MSRLPPALHHRDFRRFWLGMLGSSFGTQMVSVAVGWQVYAIHQQRVRPRPDRARGVPAARPARAAGRTARRPAAADADRGVFQLRGGGRRRPAPARDDPRRRSALAVRRARGADRRRECDRRAGRPVADARDRPDRAARRSTRDAIGRRPGRERLRPGDRRPALRRATRARLRGRRASCWSPPPWSRSR